MIIVAEKGDLQENCGRNVTAPLSGYFFEIAENAIF